MSPKPVDGRGAYLTALRMLARRELSEAQIHERLLRKGFDESSTSDAIGRLRDEHAVDDARVAASIARTETLLRRRGKLRVRRRIEQAGIAADTARQAVDGVFEDINDDELLEAALARRLRTGADLGDAKEFQRLYRYLVGQGFEPERVVAVLRQRKKQR